MIKTYYCSDDDDYYYYNTKCFIFIIPTNNIYIFPSKHRSNYKRFENFSIYKLCLSMTCPMHIGIHC